MVKVNGEITFAGDYVLAEKNSRLSDIITKAGGITPDAYVKGASLKRQLTEDEMRRLETLLQLSANKQSRDIFHCQVVPVRKNCIYVIYRSAYFDRIRLAKIKQGWNVQLVFRFKFYIRRCATENATDIYGYNSRCEIRIQTGDLGTTGKLISFQTRCLINQLTDCMNCTIQFIFSRTPNCPRHCQTVFIEGDNRLQR